MMKNILFLIFVIIALQNPVMADDSYKKFQDFLQHINKNNKTSDEKLKAIVMEAINGKPEAQYTVGIILFKGMLGTSKDYPEAFKWFKKAAEQKFAIAQFLVGECYLSGTGVTKDYIQAVKWLEKAASQGNKDAIQRLKKLGINTPE